MQNSSKEYARVLPFRRTENALGKSAKKRRFPWLSLRSSLGRKTHTGYVSFRTWLQSLASTFSDQNAGLLVIVGFLAARGTLFGEIAPFGAAFFVLVLLTKAAYALPVFLAVLAGTAFVGWSETLLWLTGGTATWVLLWRKPDVFRRVGPALQAGLTFGGFCALLMALGVDLSWPWCAAYVLLLHVSVHLLRPLVAARSSRPGQTLALEQVVGVVLLLVMVFLGLARISIGQWTPQISLSLTAILLAASQWGVGPTAVISLCIGAMVFSALPASLPAAMGMLGLTGVGTSLGASHGRFGAAVGFLAAVLIVSMDITELSILQSWWLHAATGLATFLLIPQHMVHQWTVLLPGTKASVHRQAKAESRLQREVNSRFTDLASVFTDLADTFAGLPQEKSIILDYTAQLDALSEKACQDCPSFAKCWKESFYTTYWNFMDLLTTAEKRGRVSFSDLKDEVKDTCIRPAQLVMSVNYLLEMIRLDAYWRRRIEESHGIVSAQLEGAAQVFKSFASTVQVPTEFVEQYEEKIAVQLKRAGISHQVSVSQSAGGRLEVLLTGSGCSGVHICEGQAEEIVTNVMGEKYTLWQKKCPNKKSGSNCRAVFLPERPYELEVQSSVAARNGGWVSGDTFSRIPLADGKMAFIVSDGMGSGSKAAMESSTTVKLLKELLSCGFERRFAVKIVNSILMLRTPEDSFATVDLAIVDLYSGRVEFTKIGAAPSYILRQDGEVERVQTNSIPLGILQTVDYQSESVCLEPHDTLVMVTDGIVDACKGSVGGDEWLLHYLSAPVRQDTSELAKTLLAKAQHAAGGAQDDQTVVTITLRPALQPANQGARNVTDLPIIARSTA